MLANDLKLKFFFLLFRCQISKHWRTIAQHICIIPQTQPNIAFSCILPFLLSCLPLYSFKLLFLSFILSSFPFPCLIVPKSMSLPSFSYNFLFSPFLVSIIFLPLYSAYPFFPILPSRQTSCKPASCALSTSGRKFWLIYSLPCTAKDHGLKKLSMKYSQRHKRSPLISIEWIWGTI